MAKLQKKITDRKATAEVLQQTNGQPILTSILRGFACSALGMRSLSTPSLNAASLFAVSRSRLRVKARR